MDSLWFSSEGMTVQYFHQFSFSLCNSTCTVSSFQHWIHWLQKHAQIRNTRTPENPKPRAFGFEINAQGKAFTIEWVNYKFDTIFKPGTCLYIASDKLICRKKTCRAREPRIVNELHQNNTGHHSTTSTPLKRTETSKIWQEITRNPEKHKKPFKNINLRVCGP